MSMLGKLLGENDSQKTDKENVMNQWFTKIALLEELVDNMNNLLGRQQELLTQWLPQITKLQDIQEQTALQVMDISNTISAIDVKITQLQQSVKGTTEVWPQPTKEVIEISQPIARDTTPIQQPVITPERPKEVVKEFYVIRAVNGVIEQSVIQPKENSYFRAKPIGGSDNQIEFHPLLEQADVLRMQAAVLLTCFEYSGSGSQIQVITPAIFSKSGDMWLLQLKGKLEFKI